MYIELFIYYQHGLQAQVGYKFIF